MDLHVWATVQIPYGCSQWSFVIYLPGLCTGYYLLKQDVTLHGLPGCSQEIYFYFYLRLKVHRGDKHHHFAAPPAMPTKMIVAVLLSSSGVM
jgi:hypothetical protein